MNIVDQNGVAVIVPDAAAASDVAEVIDAVTYVIDGVADVNVVAANGTVVPDVIDDVVEDNVTDDINVADIIDNIGDNDATNVVAFDVVVVTNVIDDVIVADANNVLANN